MIFIRDLDAGHNRVNSAVATLKVERGRIRIDKLNEVYCVGGCCAADIFDFEKLLFSLFGTKTTS